MVALRNMYYGRDVKAGESFDVSPEHVNLLTKTKSAKAGDPEDSEGPDKKLRYSRRDMRASK